MVILTLTMNPVLDKSTEAERVTSEKKIRCITPKIEPGGGGINVSRALHKLDTHSLAVYLADGDSGKKLAGLLDEEGVEQKVLSSGQEIRENLMVLDKGSGKQFRFGMPGPEISKKYWSNVLDFCRNFVPSPDIIVASGSLPPGIPDDFYARLAHQAKKEEIRTIIDTSGEPLKMAVEEGVFLIKPNLGELAKLVNKDSLNGMEQEEVTEELLESGKVKTIVVSMGPKGAMLATQGCDPEYIIPPTVHKISAIGAGDSMVAGIVRGISKGWAPVDAVRYGVAAGTAATITPGSELCRKEDVERIYSWINEKVNMEV